MTVGSVGGTVVGIISGYFGGFTDSVIQRVIVRSWRFRRLFSCWLSPALCLRRTRRRPSPNAGLTLSQDLFPFHFITPFAHAAGHLVGSELH